MSTAPNRIAVGALRRTLTATLVAVPLDGTYFAALMVCQPLGRLLFFLAHPWAQRTSTAAFMPRHVHQGSNFLGETFALLSCASSSQPERPPLLYASRSSHSERRPNCCNLQQRPNSSAKLLQQSSGKYLDIVASARRSGQEDFQRGTPPVSLASCLSLIHI